MWKIWNFLDLFLDLEKCACTDISRFFPKLLNFLNIPECYSRDYSRIEGGIKKNPLTTPILAGVGLLFRSGGGGLHLAFLPPLIRSLNDNCKIMQKKSIWIETCLKNEILLNSFDWNVNKIFELGVINPLVFGWKLSAYVVLILLVVGRLVGCRSVKSLSALLWCSSISTSHHRLHLH